MSEIVGTIKILDGRIITKKNDVVETWTRFGNGDDRFFITYEGITYKLLKFQETEQKVIKDEEDIEEDYEEDDF